MALQVSPLLSVIISIWSETLFYGINITVFALCMHILSTKSTPGTTNTVCICLSVALFLAATAHIVVNVRRLIEGYVDPESKGAMVMFLLDITVPTNIAKQYLVVLVNLFSDILITWRVYMVWGEHKTIWILPGLLCAGAFTSGMVVVNYTSQVVPGDTIFLERLSAWITAQGSLTLAMNLTATLLIAARIWYVTKPIRRSIPEMMHPYWRVIVILIESTSVAALAQTLQLVFYQTKFAGVYFISDTIVQIVAIAPLLVIVLVGLTKKSKSGVWATSYATSASELSELQFESRHISVDVHGQTQASSRFHGGMQNGHDVELGEVNKSTAFYLSSSSKPEH